MKIHEVVADSRDRLEGLAVLQAARKKRCHLAIPTPPEPYAVAWGSQRDIVICGDSEGMLRWWNLQSGTCLRVQKAHEGSVQSLRRSPDGTKLASCGDDGAIMLWDLHSGDYLQTLRRDRPYERMDITGVTGLTTAQVVSLKALGAVETLGSLEQVGKPIIKQLSQQFSPVDPVIFVSLLGL